jgi:hypothetical protein
MDLTPQAVKFLAWLLFHSASEERDEQASDYGAGLLWFVRNYLSSLTDESLFRLPNGFCEMGTEYMTDLHSEKSTDCEKWSRAAKNNRLWKFSRTDCSNSI